MLKGPRHLTAGCKSSLGNIFSALAAAILRRIAGWFQRRCSEHLAGHGARALAADQSGSMVAVFAVALPILLGAVGVAVDYGRLYAARASFQSAADAAALAAASDLFIVTSGNDEAVAVARQVALANLKGSAASPTVVATVSSDPPAVTVTVSEEMDVMFAGILSSTATTQVSASATANVVGSTRICVLALDDRASGAVSAETQARLTGKGCAVYSNSLSSQSIVGKNSASVEATLICAAGGINGLSHFAPTPMSDCPAVPDPLADRPAPPIGACEHSWLVIEESTTLSPGVYCGGIRVYNGATVTFNPGVYIIKDGPFIAAEHVTLSGENVGFYLTGSKAVMKLTPMSSISFTAPKEGPLAGLLFFEDKAARKTAATHVISSNDARLLLGTIYLPASDLVVDANAPVADQSAYTAIVARSLKLYSGPHLILNTDYDATDIPVPKGIRGTGNAVALIK